MTDERRHYLAYLLRLWQVHSEGELIWRASLESPHTGERHGFANLEALFAFLEEQIGSLAQRKEQPRGLSGARSGLQNLTDNNKRDA
jgi:hypothetical protein